MFSNNFNDFWASVVTLWDLLVVNNWQVFLHKFSKISTWTQVVIQNLSKIHFLGLFCSVVALVFRHYSQYLRRADSGQFHQSLGARAEQMRRRRNTDEHNDDGNVRRQSQKSGTS